MSAAAWLIPFIPVILIAWLIIRTNRDKDDSRAAPMPEELVTRKPRTVQEMRVDDEGWVSAYELSVNTKGRTFLRAETPLLEKEEAWPGRSAKIKRVASGVEALLIDRRRAGESASVLSKYERRFLFRSLKYLPVVQIAIEVIQEKKS